MQIRFLKPTRCGDRGFALILTLVFLLVSLIIFGSIMYWVSSNAKVTLHNNQFNSSEYAAEAAVEKVLSQMDRDYLSGSLTNSASWYATTLLPNQNGWSVGYTYSDTNGVKNQISVNLGSWTPYIVPLSSQYTNLSGFVQTNTITATATPANVSGAGSNWVYKVPATVSEQLVLATIPIFQFAIFYNMNLEINAAQALNIEGPVFCNAGIWTGDNIVYYSTVSAVGQVYYTTGNDPWANYSATAGSVFRLSGQPVSGKNALTMPIAGATNSNPTNVESIINLPPAAYALGTAAAYSTNGQIYLANEADLIISNTPSGTNSANPTGTNIFVYFQDQHNASALTLVTPDYYQLKKPWNAGASGIFTNYINTNKTAGIDSVTNVQFASYSFLTNVFFYDWREGWNGGSGIGGKGKAVQAIQFDVSKFNIWVTNTATNGGSYVNNNYNGSSITDKGHPIDSAFIYNFVPLTTTTLPAVRVVHGQQLSGSYGLGIATPFPVYVQGDYNIQTPAGTSKAVNSTTYTYPAAFYADAITILSSNWNDTVTSKDPSVSPSTTTVNAACLEGIVPSNLAISGDPSYSGGVENFLRLLEKWGTLYYNGSIVVMFPSQYATNRWQQTGNYYTAPTRDWAFDTNFTVQSKLPPMYPGVKGVIRGQWTAN